MANVNNPFGLKPTRFLSGAPYNGAGNVYYIPANDTNEYSPGDYVKAAAVSDAFGTMGCIKALGTDTGRGVITAVFVSYPYSATVQGINLDLTVQNIPATKLKAYYVFVADDPNILYEIVDDGLSTLTATAVNKNCSLTVTNPSTPQQMSATVLATGTVATTSSLNFRIMGLIQRDDNTFGQYAHWLVKMNASDMVSGTAGT